MTRMMMDVLSIELFTAGIALLTVLEIFTSSRRNFIWGLLPMIPPFGGVLYGLIEPYWSFEYPFFTNNDMYCGFGAYLSWIILLAGYILIYIICRRMVKKRSS